MWGAGGSLKVTILQSSDSRAFSTVSLAPGPRSGDSASAPAAAASVPSKQALQFFCYICRAGCCSQQVLPPCPGQRVGRVEGCVGCPACPVRGCLRGHRGPREPRAWQPSIAQSTCSEQPRRQEFTVWPSWFESALPSPVDLGREFTLCASVSSCVR